MSKKKNKAIQAYIIHTDTTMKLANFGDALCIAFDVGNRDMIGIAIKEAPVALALSSYFKQIARAIKKRSIEETP